MLFAFLVLADLFSFSVAILMNYAVLDSWRIGLGCAFYLITKAYIFRDFLSMTDGVVGLYIILLMFGVSFWFIYIVFALLIYKGISLIG